MSVLVQEFEDVLLSHNRTRAREILLKSAAQENPIQFVEHLIVPVMERIGVGWEAGDVALSQVYMSGLICEELMEDIIAASGNGRKSNPRLAIAVLHDYHLLGKRIVMSVLCAGGWNVQDYGQIETEALVKRVEEDHIDIVLISTLMLPSALRVKDVRQALNRDVKIVVGGAPFRLDETLWKEVGADAMGRNASDVIGILSGELL